MNELSASIQKLGLFFEQNSNLYITLLEYGATHHRGRLQFTVQEAGDRVELSFDDCFYICGAPSSGPHRFEISSMHSEKGEYLTLTGDSDQFVLKCGRMKIERAIGQSYEPFFK